MYSALTHDVMTSYLTRVQDKKFVIAILRWKQGLLCDKSVSLWFTEPIKRPQCYESIKCLWSDIKKHNKVNSKVKYENYAFNLFFFIGQYHLEGGYQELDRLPVLALVSTVKTGV